MPSICRECETTFDAAGRCPACRSPRVVSHPELLDLGVAHVDCDSFYAAVEKRDDPSLADKPVIIGGGRRGVVSTACYVARIAGVRSAMPMFKALAACPDAVVIRPRMDAYVAVSRRIRALMEAATPLVEPLSLDEAFLDLRGTERLHGGPPALTLIRLIGRIEREIGVTASVGLSHNKFLAKVASDLDKPRGFSVIGAAETLDFLADKPVSMIWGVGASLQAKLKGDGLLTIGDLRAKEEAALIARYGSMGKRLHDLSHGRDARRISSDGGMKSVSAETTFEDDIGEREALEGHLWRLAVRVADRAKAKEIAGRTITLKLKTPDFRTVTRRRTLAAPTQLADATFTTARELLGLILEKGPFRLIGVGLNDLSKAPEDGTGAAADLFDAQAEARAAAERATDAIRGRFGADAIVKGRALR
ncbi:MAG: DNA polymerase IV [Pseudomonadota bacterium]